MHMKNTEQSAMLPKHIQKLMNSSIIIINNNNNNNNNNN
jgi:hypothetical protein